MNLLLTALVAAGLALGVIAAKGKSPETGSETARSVLHKLLLKEPTNVSFSVLQIISVAKSHAVRRLRAASMRFGQTQNVKACCRACRTCGSGRKAATVQSCSAGTSLTNSSVLPSRMASPTSSSVRRQP